MKKKNLAIVSACKGYTVEDVRPWMESLTASGFTGKVFVIIYAPTQEIADYFKEKGCHVLIGGEDGLTHIATQRFADYARMLKTEHCEDVEYVLHTDIRDVIFQTNPEEWFTANLQEDKLIYASAEGVSYRHEDWNGDGLQLHFGENIFNEMADYETLCSGVFGGRKDAFIHLCEAMYQLAFWTGDPAGFIDQHFYNLLLRKSFCDIAEVVPADSPFVANMGTLVALPMNNPDWSTGPRTPYNSYERFRKGTYVEHLLTAMPQLVDGVVCTPHGEPYCIVHQYDRYTPWKDALLEKNFNITYVS